MVSRKATLRTSGLAVILAASVLPATVARMMERQKVQVATCGGSFGDGIFDWLYCPSGQDPFAIYNSIVAGCGQPPAMPLSGSGAQYPVLTSETANAACSCTTEANNLLAACAYCQGFGYPTFSDYKRVCQDIDWAHNTPNGSDLWDIDQSRRIAEEQCVGGLSPSNGLTTTTPISTSTDSNSPGGSTSFETKTTTGDLEVPSGGVTPSPLPETLTALQSCSDCPNTDCSFRNSQRKEQRVFKVLVGTPLRNCEGSRTDLEATLELSEEVSETWSVSVSLGINAGPVSFTASAGWSRSIAKTLTQTTKANVQPNTKARFVAEVLYDVTEGELFKRNTKIGRLTSNQPNSVLSYEVQVVPCNQSFVGDSRSTSPKVVCGGATRSTAASYTHA